MVMEMKLLILLDGSVWSFKAALTALEIARKKEAKATLFSVLDIADAKLEAFNFCVQSDMCDMIKDHEEQIWRERKKTIQAQMADVLYHYNKENVPTDSKVIEGNTIGEIVRETNEGGYDLVVMGAYGKNSKARLGSLSTKISKGIKVPIMVVP
jgi:nucleotide-binding universal stress UspA family protein